MIEWAKHNDQIHARAGERFCVVTHQKRVLSVFFCCEIFAEFASADAAINAVESYLSGQATAQQIAEQQTQLGLAEFQTLEACTCRTP